MGLVVGAVYFAVMFVFIPVPFAEWFAVSIRDSWSGLEEGLGEERPEFPLDKVRRVILPFPSLSLLTTSLLAPKARIIPIRPPSTPLHALPRLCRRRIRYPLADQDLVSLVCEYSAADGVLYHLWGYGYQGSAAVEGFAGD